MPQSFLQKEVLITVKDSEKVSPHLNLIKKARAKTNLSWVTFLSSVGQVSDQLHQKSYPVLHHSWNLVQIGDSAKET
jgi:hypothetical protein